MSSVLLRSFKSLFPFFPIILPSKISKELNQEVLLDKLLLLLLLTTTELAQKVHRASGTIVWRATGRGISEGHSRKKDVCSEIML